MEVEMESAGLSLSLCHELSNQPRLRCYDRACGETRFVVADN